MLSTREEQRDQRHLTNVHEGLPTRLGSTLCRGLYFYYHYFCDGLPDMGWGCGYRTLQTLCSWVQHQQLNMPPKQIKKRESVPTIKEIQSALVEMGDKPHTFLGSKQWIGSFEVCLCLDYFYDVPCKIIHVSKGTHLEQHLPELCAHFDKCGSPVMMGGETDNSSKGIMGASMEPPALLVVDPHYVRDLHHHTTRENLQTAGWVRWVELHELHANSFYNICLPKLTSTAT
ncbi:ufm1-specific protease 2 [Plakobranchus ocellatus]|uniref:Ufm1-specific protease 2 n=1 Tax=Plakobranchus ocellatus TaxID=259542 RepID=A0AAV3Z9D8_9GAST|nr:ufm1-specific protease 2 [Plakobranchus ocellatus]